MQLKITGKFSYIVFYNAENGFLVASFKANDGYGTITVTGIILNLDVHLDYHLFGNFVEHVKYGQQFKFESYEKIFLSNEDSLISYLSGNDFKGIGKKTAEKIVSIFKEETLDVLKVNCDVLLQYGFKTKHVDAIKEGLLLTQDVSKDLILLKECGLNDKILKNAKKKFKDAYLHILLNDIYYAVRHVKGLSCKIADTYIAKTNKQFDELSKKTAYYFEILRSQFFQTGDTFVYIDTLQNQEEILLLIQEQLVVVVDNRLYLTPIYNSELYIAEFVCYFLNMSENINITKELIQHESLTNIQYDKIQKKAIQAFFNESFLIVSGGPGTGKTTITKAMIHIYQQKYTNSKIAICAPTGRAAKRISEVVGVEASTIHRLLKWDIETDEFNMNEDNPLDIDLLIIDECSMIDTFLFASLLRASKNVKKILLIGDKDQLPSIAMGKVLTDLLAIDFIPRIILEHNHRQLENSGIIDFAYDVNSQKPFQSYSNVYFEKFDIQQFLTILRHYLENGMHDFQVLSSMYRGTGGIVYLNQLLQETLNPKSSVKPELKVGNTVYRKFDKVLQLKNQVDDNVYNGDIGIIEDIDVFEKIIVVNFEGNFVTYTAEMFENITLGYCISIHKSQGSEYPVLFLFLPDIHQFMFEKKLIYTAITRAKNSIHIFGNKYLIQTKVAQPQKYIRNTTLSDLIKEAMGEIT